MKHRVNKIKNKILVRGGDENSLKDNEILIKETNDTVELKERTSKGIKSIGGANNNQYYYYATHSMSSGSNIFKIICGSAHGEAILSFYDGATDESHFVGPLSEMKEVKNKFVAYIKIDLASIFMLEYNSGNGIMASVPEGDLETKLKALDPSIDTSVLEKISEEEYNKELERIKSLIK